MSFKLHHQIDRATTVIPVTAESVTIPSHTFSVAGSRRNGFSTVALACLLSIGVAACGGGGGGSTAPTLGSGDGGSGGSGSGSGGSSGGGTTSGPDFTSVDEAFQGFIDSSNVFDGISYVVVDAEGILHQEVFGDHNEDLIVMLASTSKVPAVMAMLALQEDPEVTFSIDEPVSTYLPYDGVYADRTVKQMVSNTSGIPGLRLLDQYGDPFGAIAGGEGGVNHLCQMSAQLHWDFEACGQILVQNELPDSREAGAAFDYGGSQWQIAGVTASIVANSTWNQLFDKYIGEPCGLEVFTYGNPWEELSFAGTTSFDGVSVESMPGQHNPQIEGGGISNLADYAKLLQIHVNGGYCGDTQVLSEDSLAAMRENIGSTVDGLPVPYGMGWWIRPLMPGVYTDPGAFGAVSFIDVNRGIGGYMAIDDYSRVDADAPPDFFIGEAIELIQAAVDAAN